MWVGWWVGGGGRCRDASNRFENLVLRTHRAERFHLANALPSEISTVQPQCLEFRKQGQDRGSPDSLAARLD